MVPVTGAWNLLDRAWRSGDASTRDPDIRARAGLAEGVLPGSGAIVPIAHRTSVFELTSAEWADTQDLLLQARMALHDLLAPDGYLLGWNCSGN